MKPYALLLLVCLCAAGCGFSEKRSALVPYDANCLRNMQAGREYSAEGRYELAKEHYLLALASSDDPETRSLLTRELRAVDMMIKNRR